MEVEWDAAKSHRNHKERGLPFDLAIVLFEGAVVERLDTRRDYGEVRVVSIGRVDELMLTCVYTDRGSIRRIISLRIANRRERNAYRSTYPG